MQFLIKSFSYLMETHMTPLPWLSLEDEAERFVDRLAEMLRHLRETVLRQEPCINRI